MSVLKRRQERAKGKLLVSTITVQIQESTLSKKGLSRSKQGKLVESVSVPIEVLQERLTWLGQLTTTSAQQGMREHWDKESLEEYWHGDWPVQASPAWEKCFTRLQPPRKNVYLPSRALRISQARAGECLRSFQYQYEIITRLLDGENPTNITGYDQVIIRNMTRLIRNTITTRKQAGLRKPVPTSFFEVQPSPPALSPDVISLHAVDKQLAYWQAPGSDATHQVFSIKLPLRARPVSKNDWVWHDLRIQLPLPVRQALSAGGLLSKPSLEIKTGKLLAHLPVQVPVRKPVVDKNSSRPYLGLDWGEKRLLTGVITWLDENGELHSTGRPLFFESRTIQGKLARLRKHAKRLQAKIDHLSKLLENKSDIKLAEKRDQREGEKNRVWAKYHNLSNQLAHAASRWVTEQACLHDCQEVLSEDLRNLEPRARGDKELRDRLNHQIRGKVFDYLEHDLKRVGIGFRSGSPAGTSKYCPRCRAKIHHQTASDNKKTGRGWVNCSKCGYSADRDHAGAECVSACCLNPERKRNPRMGRSKGLVPTDQPVRRSHRGRLTRLPRKRHRKQKHYDPLAEMTTPIIKTSETKTSSETKASPTPDLVLLESGRVDRARPEPSVRLSEAPRGLTKVVSPQSSRLSQSDTVSLTGSRLKHSVHTARCLDGMHSGFTGQLHFTPTNHTRGKSHKPHISNKIIRNRNVNDQYPPECPRKPKKQ